MPDHVTQKTEVCVHKFGCAENALRGWYKAFLQAFLLKSVQVLLPSLLSPKKFLRNLIDIKKNGDSIRFGLFAACMNMIYKAVLCSMRRVSKDEGKNAAIAGFAAGLASIIDEQSRRMWIALYSLARACECLLNFAEN